MTGEILLDERNIFKMNPMEVRRMAGMVFQRPNLFPTMSIYDNVLAGYKARTASGCRKRRRTRSSKRALRASDSGAKCAIRCSAKEDSSPADSSNGCASPARSR